MSTAAFEPDLVEERADTVEDQRSFHETTNREIDTPPCEDREPAATES